MGCRHGNSISPPSRAEASTLGQVTGIMQMTIGLTKRALSVLENQYGIYGTIMPHSTGQQPGMLIHTVAPKIIRLPNLVSLRRSLQISSSILSRTTIGNMLVVAVHCFCTRICTLFICLCKFQMHIWPSFP